MRGRLVFPVTAIISRIDTAATSTAAGFDDDYREPTYTTDTDGDGIPSAGRVDRPELSLKAQIETDREEIQRMTRSGDIAENFVGLVLDRKRLERASPPLIDSDGRLDFNKGDRLLRIIDRRGRRSKTYDKVEVFLTHAQMLDAWIGGTSNLALLVFEERPEGRR